MKISLNKPRTSGADEHTSGAVRGGPLAPWWHTVLVLAPIAALSVASWYQHGLAHPNVPGLNPRLSGYFTVIAVEWLQALLIWYALRRNGLSISSLVLGRWRTPIGFLRDLGISIGFLVVAIPIGGLLLHIVNAGASNNLANLTPKTVTELIVFLLLATTCGGFCEELIFRGYLTQQFKGWTGNLIVAIFLQGLIFGLAHGYYGKGMVVVMVQGWLFGLLAYWRKSLRPGMLAHGLQDVIGGIVAFFT